MQAPSDSPLSFLASDKQFHRLYAESLLHQANMHWTPLGIAKKAAAFLTAGQVVSVLDIGSGVGKFCLAAASYQPQAQFTGIEIRPALHEAAELARKQLRVANVEFIQGNIMELDFSRYQHFYFYNAFYEQIETGFRIDQLLDYSSLNYKKYTAYVFRQLEKKPAGTRLATYHSSGDEVPPGYEVVYESDLLSCWEKV
jgi:SAM-dependent methyltransferase